MKQASNSILDRIPPRKPTALERVILQARVLPEFKERVRQQAEKDGVAMEELIVACLEEYMEKAGKR